MAVCGELYFFSYRISSGSSISTGSRSNSSSKLSVNFQLLEKMNVSSAVRTLNSDDLQQVRSAASKILHHVISQGQYVLCAMYDVRTSIIYIYSNCENQSSKTFLQKSKFKLSYYSSLGLLYFNLQHFISVVSFLKAFSKHTNFSLV